MESLKDQIENAIDNITVDYERNETHIDAYVTNSKETVDHIHKVFLDAHKELIEATQEMIDNYWSGVDYFQLETAQAAIDKILNDNQ